MYTESSMAMVGVNLMINGQVPAMNDYLIHLRDSAALVEYLGDISFETPKDYTGYQWLRLYTNYTVKQSFTFFFNFVQDLPLLDPERYESSY